MLSLRGTEGKEALLLTLTHILSDWWHCENVHRVREKKRPQYFSLFRHNFDKFRHSFI